jgi:hypothetical protein
MLMRESINYCDKTGNILVYGRGIVILNDPVR